MSEQIPIWCDDDTNAPATVSTMISDGELQEVDRPHYVHWTRMQAKPS
jgi:hypothetical protein